MNYSHEKLRKKWKEVKKYRDMNIEIEKGIWNGTENEGGRLGALPSTTACYKKKLCPEEGNHPCQNA